MNKTEMTTSPSSCPVDQPVLYEKPEYNIQLVLEQGQRRILISFPSEEEAKSYFDCIQFTNLAVKRRAQVYLHLTEVNHITLKGRLGLVFNKAAHATGWLLRTRLERCFRQKQKTLWLKEPCGQRGATWENLSVGQVDTCRMETFGASVKTANGQEFQGTDAMLAASKHEKRRWPYVTEGLIWRRKPTA